MVHADNYEQLRTATIDDVGGILKLLAPLEDQGILVRRSRELLETEIHRFNVLEKDGTIIACAALYPFRSEEHTSELQSRGQLVCRLLLQKKNIERSASLMNS